MTARIIPLPRKHRNGSRNSLRTAAPPHAERRQDARPPHWRNAEASPTSRFTRLPPHQGASRSKANASGKEPLHGKG